MKIGIASVFSLLLLSLLYVPTMAQEQEVLDRGKTIYRVHCMACHGEEGRGDGPMADLLKVRPSDLSRLTARNDGKFPFERVYRTIDGREEVRGHGTRDMPLWGFAFQDFGWEANQEDIVRGRVLTVIHYLRSLQRTPPTSPDSDSKR